MTRKPFPLTFDVAYPERALGRKSTLLRLPFTLRFLLRAISIGTPCSLQLVLLIAFRKEYPQWWYEFNLQRARFAARIDACSALLTDVVPSTVEAQAVTLEFEPPNATELNRTLPFVKGLLALPHVNAMFILWLAMFGATLVAWTSILLAGTYPRLLFNYVVGVQRWSWRVRAYTSLLNTDRYPPFSLS